MTRSGCGLGLLEATGSESRSSFKLLRTVTWSLILNSGLNSDSELLSGSDSEPHFTDSPDGGVQFKFASEV